MTFDNLMPGEYTIAEDPASFPNSNWALLSVVCEPDALVGPPDLFNYRATVSVGAGQDITCVFTNQAATYEDDDPGDTNTGAVGDNRLYLPFVVNVITSYSIHYTKLYDDGDDHGE